MENFFNKLQKKYPKAMKVFCEWIDEYKKNIDWKFLFNEGAIFHVPMSPPDGDFTADAPKFHNLPYAMQLGIMLQFMQEQSGNKEETIDMRDDISGFFENLHGELVEKEAKMN